MYVGPPRPSVPKHVLSTASESHPTCASRPQLTTGGSRCARPQPPTLDVSPRLTVERLWRMQWARTGTVLRSSRLQIAGETPAPQQLDPISDRWKQRCRRVSKRGRARKFTQFGAEDPSRRTIIMIPPIGKTETSPGRRTMKRWFAPKTCCTTRVSRSFRYNRWIDTRGATLEVQLPVCMSEWALAGRGSDTRSNGA